MDKGNPWSRCCKRKSLSNEGIFMILPAQYFPGWIKRYVSDYFSSHQGWIMTQPIMRIKIMHSQKRIIEYMRKFLVYGAAKLILWSSGENSVTRQVMSLFNDWKSSHWTRTLLCSTVTKEYTYSFNGFYWECAPWWVQCTHTQPPGRHGDRGQGKYRYFLGGPSRG